MAFFSGRNWVSTFTILVVMALGYIVWNYGGAGYLAVYALVIMFLFPQIVKLVMKLLRAN